VLWVEGEGQEWAWVEADGVERVRSVVSRRRGSGVGGQGGWSGEGQKCCGSKERDGSGRGSRRMEWRGSEVLWVEGEGREWVEADGVERVRVGGQSMSSSSHHE